jgi:hypothetical protein
VPNPDSHTTRHRDFPMDWDDGTAWRYSPDIKKEGREFIAKAYPTGFELHAYHEDRERGMQEIVIVSASVEEAPRLGEWLSRRADQSTPAGLSRMACEEVRPMIDEFTYD